MKLREKFLFLGVEIMKQLRRILLVLFVICCGVCGAFSQDCVLVKESGVGEFHKKQALKYLGLFYCLDLTDKEYVKDLLYRLSAKANCSNCIKIMDSKMAFDELKVFIDKKKKELNQLACENNCNKRESTAICLSIYESDSFDTAIERIIKKYCKECK